MLKLLPYRFALFLAVAVRLCAEPTFYQDVLPILRQRCQSCHQKGEIGPMLLLTYEQTRPWAKAIRQSVTLKKMPPWFADPRFGEFANDPSLTDDQISTIQKWVDSGAHAGEKVETPAPVAGGLANPTVVTKMSQPFHLPARATIPYTSFVLPVTFTTDTWASAIEIRPSDRSVVHHAVLYVRESGQKWLEKVPPTADILAVYTPGAPVMNCPEGMAKKIPAGSELVLQMHYTAGKIDTKDQTQVSLVTSPKRPGYRLLTLQMANYDLDIPPGDKQYRAVVSGTLPQDALLISMFPHMHLRGSGFEYQILAGRGGRVENLLKVNDYNFYWQLSYRLKTPKLLPAGTRLLFAGYFDNSANNPRNPDPTAEVTWGEQSWEEMMVGFFDVAVSPDIDKEKFFVRN